MSLRAASEIPDWLDVSRETLERFAVLEALIRKWTPAINLVSKADVGQLWDRHILDSAQLFEMATEEVRIWADLGSGSGFPGIVIAILARQRHPELAVHLVEADRRKASFLAQAIRHLDLRCVLHVARIESLPPLAADIVSARALATLPELCRYAHRHLSAAGTALFMKGEGVDAEILACGTSWQMALERQQSRTRPGGVILKIKDLRHV